jgi:quinol monooxygenase YgiN
MTTEHITVSVQYKIKKKKLAKAKDAILEYVEAVKKNEPGTTEYKVYQYDDDNAVFIHIMSFVDKSAKKTHEKSEHLKKLKKILVPISKGKAVYTNMVEMKHTKSQETTGEIKKDVSSHEPV